MLFIITFANLKYYKAGIIVKESILLLLFTGIYIYIVNSKRIPIIMKNNIRSFVVQTVISMLAIMSASLISSLLYGCNSSIIIYNKPNGGFYSKFAEQAYYFEYIIRGTCMILYIVFGMSLTSQKSKIKNFLSVFICYIVLIIDQLVNSFYFEDIYVWVSYIFINRSSHELLQKSTPLIYNSVFFLLLFVPTLLMWVGLELKSMYNTKFIKNN